MIEHQRVPDGYNGTRVAKFDASGKFLLEVGTKGGGSRRQSLRG
jgi:hypothetical protein